MKKQKFARKHSLDGEATFEIEFEGEKFIVGANGTVSAALFAYRVEDTRATGKKQL